MVLAYESPSNDAGIRVKSVYGRSVNDILDQPTIETTIYLVDPHNHTGYAQVLEEMVYNYTGTLTSRKTYTIGDDVITEAQWLSHGEDYRTNRR